MKIREYQDSDIKQIVLLFYETVHSVNTVDYSIEQLHAWAPRKEIEKKLKGWNIFLGNNITYVAEINGKIVGFVDMSYRGYLDRLYTHKDYLRQGIATALVNKVESVARKIRLSEIHTEASVTARPFFEAHGYEVMRAQNVERMGVTLPNFHMRKTLVAKS